MWSEEDRQGPQAQQLLQLVSARDPKANADK